MAELLKNHGIESWNVFEEAYAQHEQQYQLVELEVLAALLKAEHTLQIMMKHAVHNWDGFENCMIEVQKGVAHD